MTFRERGRKIAEHDDRYGQWGDVPAVLTATYSSAPTRSEMQEFGSAYLAEILRRGNAGSAVEREWERLRSFIRGGGRSGCEPHFFGSVDPAADRAGGPPPPRSGARRYRG